MYFPARKFFVAECVDACRVVDNVGSVGVFHAFGYNDGVGAAVYVALTDPPGEAFCKVFIYDIPVNRDFGNQDAVGFCGNAASEGGVPCVTAEDFGYEYPVVGFTGRFEVVDELCDSVDGGVAADRVGLEVEIHGFRGVDAVNTLLAEIDHHASRVVAAADNESVEGEFFHAALDAVVFVRVPDGFDFHS